MDNAGTDSNGNDTYSGIITGLPPTNDDGGVNNPIVVTIAAATDFDANLASAPETLTFSGTVQGIPFGATGMPVGVSETGVPVLGPATDANVTLGDAFVTPNYLTADPTLAWAASCTTWVPASVSTTQILRPEAKGDCSKYATRYANATNAYVAAEKLNEAADAREKTWMAAGVALAFTPARWLKAGGAILGPASTKVLGGGLAALGAQGANGAGATAGQTMAAQQALAQQACADGNSCCVATPDPTNCNGKSMEILVNGVDQLCNTNYPK